MKGVHTTKTETESTYVEMLEWLADYINMTLQSRKLNSKRAPMCGIFVSTILSNAECDPSQYEPFQDVCLRLRNANALRGPDAQGSCSLKFDLVDISEISLTRQSRFALCEFYASELCLRGEQPIFQPHREDQNIFCWNGEIFDGIDVTAEENDGMKLFELLCSAQTPEQIREVLNRVEGPYAFVFYHMASQRLYFARDPLGRRSLLIHRPSREMPYILLASVSAGPNSAYNFSELSTQHIFSLDVKLLNGHIDIANGFQQALVEMSRISSPNLTLFAEVGKVNDQMPQHDQPSPISLVPIPGFLISSVDGLITHLDRSVMLRVRNVGAYPMTKGKGRVAILFSGGIDSTVITYLAHRHIPLDEPIDLLNVAFENPRKVKLQKEGNLGAISKKRHRKLGQNNIQGTHYTLYNVPDRVTGLEELEELRRLCQGRTWNFVEINVSFEECQAARPIVESIMAPARTVMDLSLALALYFASRGVGQLRETRDSPPVPYISEARVLLNGLGSDELLGGYGRHRSVYKTGSWEAVISELKQEIERLPMRNLGRDDRVISSHGKETRHPFLSLTVVSYLTSLPVHFKLDPRLEVGFGDKMLLRLAARKLGLIEASSRKKRAMQFGSHSAKMDDIKRGDAVLD